MDYRIWSHILFELAISVSGEKELGILYKKAGTTFLRKLNCVQVAVLKKEDEFLEPVFSMPSFMQNDELFLSIVNQLQLENPEEMEKQTFEIEKDLIFYAYPLKDFGILVLRRSVPFDRALYSELLSVMDILGNNCKAIAETQKRMGSEQACKKQERFQHCLMRTAIEFLRSSAERTDDKIQKLLITAAEYTESERTCLLDYDSAHKSLYKRFEYGEDHLQGNGSSDLFDDDTLIKGHVEKEIRLYSVASNPKIKSVALIPVKQEEKSLGFIRFDSKQEVEYWSKDQTEQLKDLAELFSYVMIKVN